LLVGRASETNGYVVELVDRGAHCAQSGEALVSLARGDRDLSGRAVCPSLKLGLDELCEVTRNVDVSGKRRSAEGSPGLAVDRHAR